MQLAYPFVLFKYRKVCEISVVGVIWRYFVKEFAGNAILSLKMFGVMPDGRVTRKVSFMRFCISGNRNDEIN